MAVRSMGSIQGPPYLSGVGQLPQALIQPRPPTIKCVSRPLGGSLAPRPLVLNLWVPTPLGVKMTLSQGSHIIYSVCQIFTL